MTLSFHVSFRLSRRCLSRASNVDKNLQAKVFSFALAIRHSDSEGVKLHQRKVSEFDVHLETFMRTTNFSCISKNHQHKGECYLIAFVFDSAI